MPERDRPLSPHLSVYKWEISNTLSILHRMTGVFLSIGAVVLVVWLVAAASGLRSYELLIGLLRGPIGSLLMLGWSYCFFYHLANGIRHLVWDVGYGFDRQTARMSGWAVVLVSVILTVAFWLALIGNNGV